MPTIPSLHRPRVLLVEDEPKLRESIAEGLRLEDWVVVATENGVEALSLLAAEDFDLLVLDWMLPDLDGIDVLRRVRQSGRNLPVVITTARSAHHDEARAFQIGADGFVKKPFAFSHLLERCRAALQRRTGSHKSMRTR